MSSLYPHRKFVAKANWLLNLSVLLSVFSASSVFCKFAEINYFPDPILSQQGDWFSGILPLTSGNTIE